MKRNQGSFRDPSGYVFEKEGRIFRTVSSTYKEHFEALTAAGLYNQLVEAGCLLPFKESDDGDEKAYVQ